MRTLSLRGQTGMLLAAAFVIFVFFSAFFQVSDVDVGYHMRTAQHIVEGQGIPKTNTFSYTTPEQPWLLQQWLGTLIFYLPYRIGGVSLLIGFKALIATCLMLLVWASARRLAGPASIWPWWAVTLGTLSGRVRFFERSDLLSAVFCAGLFYLDICFGRNRRWQWIGLPVLIAVWANVHAGVMYGAALLAALSAAEWVSWIWQRVYKKGNFQFAQESLSFRELCVRPVGMSLAVLAAVLSVQLINPNGCQVLWVPISQFSSRFWQATILEYQRPDFGHYKLFYFSIALLVVLQAATWRKVNLKLLFASLGFAYLGCRSQRSILFFVITAMPHLAFMASQLRADFLQFIKPTRLSWILLPATWLVLVIGLFIPDRTFLFGSGFFHPYYPLEIYSFIQTEVASQNLFNEMRYGGSMLWWLYPRFKPFIDGRGDAFTEDFWTSQYYPVLWNKPGSDEILKKYNVTGALLPIYEDHTIPPLATRLHADTNWALVAFNDETLLFLERTPGNAEVIRRHEFQYLWPAKWLFDSLESPQSRSKATEEAERAFKVSPNSLFAQTALARACLLNEKFADAAAILGKFAADENVGVNYLRDYGYTLFRLGRLEEADQIFARMLRRQYLPGFAWYMRSLIAAQRGQTAEAHDFLAQAIKAEPANPEYQQALKRLSGA
jgi:hypothetical protein